MSTTQQVLAFGRPEAASRSWRPRWPGGPRGSDISWAIAFFVPYVAVFAAFVVYPIIYGLWLGSDLTLYAAADHDAELPDHGGQHACCWSASA